MNVEETLRQIEDDLSRKLELDPGEARIYYYLFRHSRLIGKHDAMISVLQLIKDLNSSNSYIKPRLRSLQTKGVIQVVSTGWAGTTIRVLLPTDIPDIVVPKEDNVRIDIEEIDFFKDTRHRPAIFEREAGLCFYCQKSLSHDNYGLDHVEPQIKNGTNNYRNVVAACHACNSSKGADSGPEFVRCLYRRGFLSESELEERLGQLERLSKGLLRPLLTE